AMTAASVAHIAPQPPVAMAAPSVPQFAAPPAPPASPRAHGAGTVRPPLGEPAGNPATPHSTATSALVTPARRRPWWWITVSLIAVASTGIALIYSSRDTTTATLGSTAVVAASEPPALAPIDAGAADSSTLAPADARTPAWLLPENPPEDARPKATRPGAPHASGAEPQPGPAKDATTHTVAPDRAGHESTKPPVARSVADVARDAKNICLESADMPWNTAMCWCAKKDKARAQASFAKLSGFKRATVRTFCSVRGIDLTP
ncbi:MAG TPA: hypothetical protein VHW23_23885, partial [Kofleriaceae bacterium]|nr:hypothetical protein [Kofleriaceae bacterium]